MIKITQYSLKKQENIEFDVYVPVDIKFKNTEHRLEKPLYLQLGDFQKNLLEIGIDEKNRTITEITLVICDKIFEESPMLNENRSLMEGCPSVEFQPVGQQMFYKKKTQLKVYIEHQSIYILFGEMKIVYLLENERITFLLDVNKYLMGIKIKDVSKREKEIFRNALR